MMRLCWRLNHVQADAEQAACWPIDQVVGVPFQHHPGQRVLAPPDIAYRNTTKGFET